MNKEETLKISFVDADHVWIDGHQFVSLERFWQAKKDVANEIKLLNDKNRELTKENEALKVLLKNQLNESIKN